MDGNTLIVGTGGSRGEAAYVFDVTSGELLQKIARPAAGTSEFGSEVAIYGNLALVSDRDSAYLFDVQTENILRTFRAGGSDYYGSRVALDENNAYISLPDDSAVFQFDLDTGRQVRKLRGNDTGFGDLFGEHLALTEGRLLVGAFYAPAAYLFDTATGAQLQKYQVPGAMRLDGFGSVDLSGDLVLVGAPDTNIDGVADVGAAYLFDASSGNLLSKLRLDELEFNNGFGRSVVLEGNSIIIGAPGLYDYAGAVFVFEVPEQSAAHLCSIGVAFLVFAIPPRL
jgi:outer membrane protein assembly factor BamB